MYKLNSIYRKASEMGPEVETSRVLASLVYHQKPTLCLETGCATGDTSFAIGEVLKLNMEQGSREARLYTCDIDPQNVDITARRCANLPVWAFPQLGEDLIVCESARLSGWDFVFIDSGWTPVRNAEVQKLLECGYTNPGCIVCTHDVSQNYSGPYYEMCKSGWPHIILHGPFGLAIFQKPWPDGMIGSGRMVHLSPL